MGKTYKTAQGKMVDMESLVLKHELTPAVGNMRVNARGDQLGPGGKIVKTREELMSEHYNQSVTNRDTSEYQPRPDLPEHIGRKNAPIDVPTSSGRAQEIEPVQEESAFLQAVERDSDNESS